MVVTSTMLFKEIISAMGYTETTVPVIAKELLMNLINNIYNHPENKEEYLDFFYHQHLTVLSSTFSELVRYRVIIGDAIAKYESDFGRKE